MNRRSIVFALLVFSIAANLFSQSQTSSGDIRGTIVDATGGVLPGAAITITNIDTRVERSATSDTFGNFRVFLLTPGEYELKIQLAGFSTYVRRPVQVTSDLAGFWERLYPQVRKELSRRYPKHKWPEKPV